MRIFHEITHTCFIPSVKCAVRFTQMCREIMTTVQKRLNTMLTQLCAGAIKIGRFTVMKRTETRMRTQMRAGRR